MPIVHSTHHLPPLEIPLSSFESPLPTWRGFFSTTLCIAGATVALLASHSEAASFDCAGARTATEKTICADAALSKLDEQLAVAYRQTLAKTASKDSVRQWQKAWLSGTRDNCPDPACLKTAYTAQLDELREHAEATSVTSRYSGEYERGDLNRPARHPATIHVFELSNGRARIIGSAVWVGNAATGNVNTGEINGLAKFDGNRIRHREQNGDCRMNIAFSRNGLVVTDDSLQCGGMNVTFDGNYRRVGASR